MRSNLTILLFCPTKCYIF